jgi:hypothetical protein
VTEKLHKWWASWYHLSEWGDFELDTPWWATHVRETDGAATICVAIKAKDFDDVWRQVRESYPDPSVVADIEVRFCDKRSDDWAPFSGRFSRDPKWRAW